MVDINPNFPAHEQHLKFPVQRNITMVHKGVPESPPPLSKAPTPWPSLPPLFKIFVFPPLLSVPPPFKVFKTVSPTLTQCHTALIRPTNFLWFKQMSKGRFYQSNCQFYQKSIFNLLNSFTNHNLLDIFSFIFRQLRMTFFHKIMVAEENNSSSNA